MTNNNKTITRKLYLPVAVFFFIISLLLFFLKARLLAMGLDPAVPLAGNLVLFAATLLSLFLYQRAMLHASTQGFLRNAYSGLMVKLVICLLGLGVYALVKKEGVDKYGIFICVFLYLIYSVIEMRSLMRWNKERTNA